MGLYKATTVGSSPPSLVFVGVGGGNVSCHPSPPPFLQAAAVAATARRRRRRRRQQLCCNCVAAATAWLQRLRLCSGGGGGNCMRTVAAVATARWRRLLQLRDGGGGGDCRTGWWQAVQRPTAPPVVVDRHGGLANNNAMSEHWEGPVGNFSPCR